MSGSRIKIVYFLACLLITGCTSYKLPIQTENHPASSDTVTSQIKLSPILDLDENKNHEDCETDVHSHN